MGRLWRTNQKTRKEARKDSARSKVLQHTEMLPKALEIQSFGDTNDTRWCPNMSKVLQTPISISLKVKLVLKHHAKQDVQGRAKSQHRDFFHTISHFHSRYKDPVGQESNWSRIGFRRASDEDIGFPLPISALKAGPKSKNAEAWLYLTSLFDSVCNLNFHDTSCDQQSMWARCRRATQEALATMGQGLPKAVTSVAVKLLGSNSSLEYENIKENCIYINLK